MSDLESLNITFYKENELMKHTRSARNRGKPLKKLKYALKYARLTSAAILNFWRIFLDYKVMELHKQRDHNQKSTKTNKILKQLKKFDEQKKYEDVLEKDTCEDKSTVAKLLT